MSSLDTGHSTQTGERPACHSGADTPLSLSHGLQSPTEEGSPTRTAPGRKASPPARGLTGRWGLSRPPPPLSACFSRLRIL